MRESSYEVTPSKAGPGAADESLAGQHGCGSRLAGQTVPGSGALVSGGPEVAAGMMIDSQRRRAGFLRRLVARKALPPLNEKFIVSFWIV